MATFLIIAKIAGVILALRFFQIITSVKTAPNAEPNFFGFQIAQYSKALKLFFAAILALGVISFIPFRDIYDSFTQPKVKTVAATKTTSFDKKDLIGTWEIEGYTHTVEYKSNRKIELNYADHDQYGAWNINKNKLLITLNGNTTSYTIDQLTATEYTITNDESGLEYHATKLD